MRRRSVLIAFGILLLVGCAILGILALLARHEPGFYRQAEVKPGKRRETQSKAFVSEFVQFTQAIANHEPIWHATFTEAQINSFFEEEFISSKIASRLLPDSVTAPRVVLEDDKIRLAFRYGTPPWSTIISIEFRVWVAPKERNVVVLELHSLHAGSLPISAQTLLQQLSETISKQNIDVTWYRHNGNPAAVLRFQSDRPTVQLRQLELKKGQLRIVGRSLESAPAVAPRADARPAATTPLGN